MLGALVVFHVLVCLFIIGMVLVQSTQQGGMGGLFGGGASQTVFGSGTQTAIGKATTVAGILFFVVCIMISFVVEKERSVIKMEEGVLQQKIEGQSAPAEEGAAPGKVAIPEAQAPAENPPAE